jgi:hypothetical protein
MVDGEIAGVYQAIVTSPIPPVRLGFFSFAFCPPLSPTPSCTFLFFPPPSLIRTSAHRCMLIETRELAPGRMAIGIQLQTTPYQERVSAQSSSAPTPRWPLLTLLPCPDTRTNCAAPATACCAPAQCSRSAMVSVKVVPARTNLNLKAWTYAAFDKYGHARGFLYPERQ